MDGNAAGTLRIVHDPSDSINVDGVLAKMLRSRDGPAILQNQGLQTPQLAYRSSHRVRAAHHQNARKNTAQSSLAEMNSFFDSLPVHAHEEPQKSARVSPEHDDMVRLVGSPHAHHERSAGDEWDAMAKSMDAAVHLYHTEGDAALEKALQVFILGCVCLYVRIEAVLQGVCWTTYIYINYTHFFRARHTRAHKVIRCTDLNCRCSRITLIQNGCEAVFRLTRQDTHAIMHTH
jgi:hypothetical protein